MRDMGNFKVALIDENKVFTMAIGVFLKKEFNIELEVFSNVELLKESDFKNFDLIMADYQLEIPGEGVSLDSSLYKWLRLKGNMTPLLLFSDSEAYQRDLGLSFTGDAYVVITTTNIFEDLRFTIKEIIKNRTSRKKMLSEIIMN